MERCPCQTKYRHHCNQHLCRLGAPVRTSGNSLLQTFEDQDVEDCDDKQWEHVLEQEVDDGVQATVTRRPGFCTHSDVDS